MTNLESYLQLPIDTLQGKLFEAAGREAQQSSIQLSDALGTTPYALTPEMHTWYRECIDHPRRNALAEIIAAFTRDRVRDVKGFLFEARREEAALVRDRQRHALSRKFFNDYHSEIEEYRDARRDLEVERSSQDHRKPIDVPLSQYAFGLLVVWIAEAFLNFESFLQVPFIHSPFIALGTTILIGFSIAFSSHLHGTVLRQWDHYFGPEDRTRNWVGYRLLTFGGTLIAIPLVLVGGARYYFLIPQLEEAYMLGTAPPSIPISIAFMLLGNVIVYLVGVVWAFFCHDPSPEYPRKARAYKNAKARFDRLYKREVRDELHRAQQVFANQEKIVAAEDRHQREAPSYDTNRQNYGQFTAFDAKVTGALERYRGELVRKAQAAGRVLVFRLPDIDVETGDEFNTLTAEEYLGISLSLKHHGAAPK